MRATVVRFQEKLPGGLGCPGACEGSPSVSWILKLSQACISGLCRLERCSVRCTPHPCAGKLLSVSLTVAVASAGSQGSEGTASSVTLLPARAETQGQFVRTFCELHRARLLDWKDSRSTKWMNKNVKNPCLPNSGPSTLRGALYSYAVSSYLHAVVLEGCSAHTPHRC